MHLHQVGVASADNELVALARVCLSPSVGQALQARQHHLLTAIATMLAVYRTKRHIGDVQCQHVSVRILGQDGAQEAQVAVGFRVQKLVRVKEGNVVGGMPELLDAVVVCRGLHERVDKVVHMTAGLDGTPSGGGPNAKRNLWRRVA